MDKLKEEFEEKFVIQRPHYKIFGNYANQPEDLFNWFSEKLKEKEERGYKLGQEAMQEERDKHGKV